MSYLIFYYVTLLQLVLSWQHIHTYVSSFTKNSVPFQNVYGTMPSLVCRVFCLQCSPS
ncbi:hypothetical protein M758_12G110900 [Ceratodon purpureus]|nr:hypothetical protein M758_12G110900 [Ceratodon purpureus]